MSKRNVSSTSCKNVQFDETKLADVLHLMRKPAINTIKITVTVSSANRTRVFPEMKWVWANEIGRTLISLISRAESMFASAIYTFPLEVGMEKVSMEVTEEPTGCLTSGKEGLDLVFDSLLDKLFLHMEDKDKDRYYKLCRPYDDNKGPVQFKCCGKLGDGKLSICGDYSSIVLRWALPGLIVGVVIFSSMTLPFLLEYIITYKYKDFYETSFSHMSLISIVSMIFFEGQGTTKSLFRRYAFVGVTWVVLFLTDFLGIWELKILFGIWAILFCFDMTFDMTDNELEPRFGGKLISCFSGPFFLPFNFIRSLSKNTATWHQNCAPIIQNLIDFLKSSLVCILTLIYFTLVFPFLVAKNLLCFIFDFFGGFVFPYRCYRQSLFEKLKNCYTIVLRLFTLVAIVFLMVSSLIFVLSIIVGVILNGEFFSPFIAPVVTLIVFFWKNWKFSVEAQCLQLKTLIIEVGKQKITSLGADEKDSSNVPTENIGETSFNNDASLTTSPVSNEVNHSGDIGASETRSNRTATSNAVGGDNRREDDRPDESTGEPNNEGGRRTTWYVPDLRQDGNGYQECGSSSHDVNNNAAEKSLAIKFDTTGEAIISREFFKEVSKIVLSLDHLLFCFFRRVVIVGIYAWIMFIVMILVQETGLSGSLQAISTIVAILVPFVFDMIYADHHSAQKYSGSMAMKERLGHTLRVCGIKENMIVFKLINIDNEESGVSIQPCSLAIDIAYCGERCQPV
ncbi:uncharacterized protein LOC114537209 [Dendronephthya gigantea]|uniref:uncharacterized protein LOC114537209 n=1 Tax=Dendronephthya gigantea TaxID=151771 RepID=UPI00106BD8EB|nr:uncharacterized protein LOC114537209 [Dendronephthya gigantea]